MTRSSLRSRNKDKEYNETLSHVYETAMAEMDKKKGKNGKKKLPKFLSLCFRSAQDDVLVTDGPQYRDNPHQTAQQQRQQHQHNNNNGTNTYDADFLLHDNSNNNSYYDAQPQLQSSLRNQQQQHHSPHAVENPYTDEPQPPYNSTRRSGAVGRTLAYSVRTSFSKLAPNKSKKNVYTGPRVHDY